ncbi:membrane frizzled-related protein-like [Babylonia areolata]|uniref:membrane frizzled-related protein-like n=1 Tax=Babylonia areolata TaxID=304850 RepID=UPI003FD12475
MTQIFCSRFVHTPKVTLCYLYFRLAVILVAMGIGKCYECGGYIGMDASSTGTIQSPGYPGNYPDYTRCIWILEAPSDYVTRLTVTFQGETYNSACSDYVQIRDGGETGTVLQSTCGNLTSSVVTSSGRWMYVFFTSDGISQADGLSAYYSAVYVGSSINSSISNPTRDCRTFEFECSNKLCISQSYRCDGYYDCGCGEDCDEYGCGGIDLAKSETLAIGFCLGIVLFIVVAMLGRKLEKARHWEKEMRTSHRGHGNNRSTSSARGGVRLGWGSAKNSSKVKGGYTPQSSVTNSPRVPPCAIRVSEIA